MNVNICYDSRDVFIVQGSFGEGHPVGMMAGTYERFFFAIQGAGYFYRFWTKKVLGLR